MPLPNRPLPAPPRPCRRRLLAAIGSSLLTLVAAAPAHAQSNAPVRILVGFPAGGTIDLVARLLAERLQADLGQTVIVDSRPGAGGQIAAQALKQAAPDGRTLLLSPDHTMVMLPLTMKTTGFAPATDFAPVSPVARYPGALAVPAALPVRTLPEYLAWAKAHPAQANVGVPAPGSVPQFLVHLMAQDTGAPLNSVPYRGSAPLVQDLIGAQINAGTTALGDFVEPHRAGRLRVVAVLAPQRAAALPEVPTFAEQGTKIDWLYWIGLFAPAGTPPAEVAKLNAAVGRALARPEVREKMAQVVFDPAPGPADELARWVREGSAFWAPVVKSSGWVPQ